MPTFQMAAGNMTPFAEVVSNVQNGDPKGLDQLYGVIQMLSGSLRRQLGYRDFEDRIHDIFLVAVDSIRDGKLREPAALSSYIHGIARLSLCSMIGVRSRRQRLSGSLQHWVMTQGDKATPEQSLVEKERTRIMQDLLETLTAKEREILTRFYIHEQTKEQICSEMALSDTQFRLAKSRAKQRLSRAGVDHRPAMAAAAAA